MTSDFLWSWLSQSCYKHFNPPPHTPYDMFRLWSETKTSFRIISLLIRSRMSHGHTTRNNTSKSLDLFAGGLAGATATAVTYPLEVLKTRLQSSTYNYRTGRVSSRVPLYAFGQNMNLSMASPVASVRHATLVSYTRQMIQNEGYSLLSRGFAMNVLAVSMSKAIYFPVYSCCKRFLGQNRVQTESAIMIHSSSAAIAGFISCTVTNPVWFLKTRLQLDSGVNKQNWGNFKMPVALAIYRNEGIQAFYTGLAASYLGIVETMLHFAIYEYLRNIIRERENASTSARLYLSDCVLAAAVSKTIATITAYPHEVLRTRSREPETEGNLSQPCQGGS